MKILFVCTGNTCRSSMAEALAKTWLKNNAPGRVDIEISSAGLAAFSGSCASYEAIEVLRQKGIDLSGHRARLFSSNLAENSDLILAMTQNHKRQILGKFPGAFGKVFTLAEACAENHLEAGGVKDIADPFGLPEEVYRRCAEDLASLIDCLMKRVVGTSG